MLKQVQQLENSTDVSVKTAEELVSRNLNTGGGLVLLARVVGKKKKKNGETDTNISRTKHSMTAPIRLEGKEQCICQRRGWS